MTDLIKIMNSHVIRTNTYYDYIPTGFSKLDELIHGFRKSNLIVITSEPGGGKTTFALSILYNIIQTKNNDVMLFSRDPYVSYTLFRVMMGRDMESLSELCKEESDEFFAVYDKKIANLAHIYSESIYNSYEELFHVLRTKTEIYPKAIFIDDLSSLKLLDKSRLNKDESETHYVVHQLKELSLQLDTPIVIMINNYAETDDFCYGDVLSVFDQGACMEYSDVYIKISHPEARHKLEDAQGNILKNREVVEVKKNKNGKLGEFFMHFDNETGLISDEIKQAGPDNRNSLRTEGIVDLSKPDYDLF